MLIDEIKKSNMMALKNKDNDTRAILSVVINKYMLLTVSKREKNEEPSDQDLVQIIQKTIKELSDEKEAYLRVDNLTRVESIDNQRKAIEQYLPKMLSEDEIKNEIENLEDKSIPSIMKHFKTKFAGSCDMGLVNKIARTF